MLLDLDVVCGSLLGGVGGHGHGHHHHPHGQNMSEHDHEHAHNHEHEHMNHEHMKHEHRDREHMNNHEHMDHDEHTMLNEVEAIELEPVTERIKIIRKPPKPKRKGKNGKGKNGKNGNRNRSGRRFGRNKLNSVVPPFNFRIPKTSFSCKGRAPGYYADMEAECKVSISKYRTCKENSRTLQIKGQLISKGLFGFFNSPKK